jgi:TPR repeat protein
MMRNRILTIAIGLTTFCLYSNAQSTFQIMLQKAQEGDPKAQNNIAAYYKQVGDCESAYYWYCQAIRQGDVVAEYGIGQCHAIGCGTEQNYRLAAFHFQRAAEKGLKEAQLVLAEMYERGLGVPQDDQKAMYWRNKAK